MILLIFGQLIFGQLIFGQMIFGQLIFGQLIFGQLIFGQLIFGQLIFGQLIFGQLIFGQLIFGQTPGHRSFFYGCNLASNNLYLGATDWCASCVMCVCLMCDDDVCDDDGDDDLVVVVRLVVILRLLFPVQRRNSYSIDLIFSSVQFQTTLFLHPSICWSSRITKPHPPHPFFIAPSNDLNKILEKKLVCCRP